MIIYTVIDHNNAVWTTACISSLYNILEAYYACHDVGTMNLSELMHVIERETDREYTDQPESTPRTTYASFFTNTQQLIKVYRCPA